MNTTLRAAKQIIRTWISDQFSDQKLFEVYAFNHDGRMKYSDSCSCILGVTLSDTLHTLSLGNCFDGTSHYIMARNTIVGARAVELAYRALGLDAEIDAKESHTRNEIRRRRLSPILRAEIRRRDRVRAPKCLELVSV